MHHSLFKGLINNSYILLEHGSCLTIQEPEKVNRFPVGQASTARKRYLDFRNAARVEAAIRKRSTHIVGVLIPKGRAKVHAQLIASLASTL